MVEMETIIKVREQKSIFFTSNLHIVQFET